MFRGEAFPGALKRSFPRMNAGAATEMQFSQRNARFQLKGKAPTEMLMSSRHDCGAPSDSGGV